MLPIHLSAFFRLPCWIFAAVLGLSFTSSACAQYTVPGTAQDSQETGNSLVNATAMLDSSAIIPGKTVLLGVRYVIHPKWHIYWKNAGDTGAPTVLKITVPSGFSTGAIRWPRPEVFSEHGDTSFGYGKETMLFVPITAPEQITGETVTIGIKTDWLVCKGVCMFGEAEISLKVPVAKAGETVKYKRDDSKSVFHRMLAEVPKPIASMPGAQVNIAKTPDGPVLRIEGPARRGAQVCFLPDYTPGVRYSGKLPFKAKTNGAKFQLEIPLEVAPDDSLGKPLRVAGIVTLGKGRSSPALEVEMPYSTEPSEENNIDSP